MLEQQAFNFCTHCGKPIGQDQSAGLATRCQHCGKPIGKLTVAPAISAGTVVTQGQVIDRRDRPIQQGVAAHCRKCDQTVQTKGSGAERSFVPHFQKGVRKMCPASGRRVED
jgi:hypothetical protein